MDVSVAQKNFPNIFSKGKIGKFETTNRVKWAACCVSNFNNRDGTYSEREYARDRVIANMECGIVTNQGAYPDKLGLGKAYWSQVSISDDKYIPGLSKVADIFHKTGGSSHTADPSRREGMAGSMWVIAFSRQPWNKR